MKKREWLTEARLRKGFETQAQLASEIGIAKSYLSAIESGDRTPSGKTAMKISSLLGVPLEKFFDEEEKEEKKGIHSLKV